ncbi:xanthine dehydrogenase small subunit [Iodidimonas gelatinilytica]|uniref:Xanthine dehydrogenase small subunit n=1 Tax=Iodidimonas gelatinilytica TaxID=1236966 RepID=A0A5A7MX10_9PROT|nr:xanthine dehydrogenase small subunit [Iodidimonas gelatinilytica]GEQ98411.1 xanthine dehydrogenase small subunit [Iodidimonas gelatinilytica]GER00398.1 xanthine dehydrogenase small subunit [Iodidimonas gelatinilytica]
MSDSIRFYLNGTLIERPVSDSTQSVLSALRYDLRLTGTKEGCAEGDCGACTLVLGSLEGGKLCYRAVNACILFLPELDGKDVYTVEGLRRADGTLHPVQQAMVDLHASQCGFCTPGFVMALYAHYLNGGSFERAVLKDVVAGNLCRCTGYGPILDAGERIGKEAPSDHDHQGAVKRLSALKRDIPLDIVATCPINGKPKRYQAPRSSDELAHMLVEAPDAVLLAGGTDVGLWVTKQHKRLDHVISLTAVEDLRFMQERDGWLEIGAGVRHSDAMDRLGALYPDFGELLRRFGSVQVRNSGTLGGNIANGSPIGDSPPPLIALGARIVLRRGDVRRELALEDFFIDYGKQDRQAGEFLESVHVPLPIADRIFKCYKISKRFDQDISAVCAALSIRLEGDRVCEARIAFGGMAATPKRASRAESALMGQKFTEATMRQAMKKLADDFAPITDMRASADYRLKVAQNLLLKAWLESAGDEGPLRLVGKEAAHV